MAAAERIPTGHLRSRAQQGQRKVGRLRRQIKDQVAQVIGRPPTFIAITAAVAATCRIRTAHAAMLALALACQPMAGALAQSPLDATENAQPIKSAVSGAQTTPANAPPANAPPASSPPANAAQEQAQLPSPNASGRTQPAAPFPITGPALPARDPLAAGNLTVADVVASIARSFPVIEQARLQAGVAGGEVLAANGFYDHKLQGYTLSDPTGVYRNYRQGIGLARQLWWGGYLSAGYRLGRGDFEPWYKERETDKSGEFKLGLVQPLLQGRAIDQRAWRSSKPTCDNKRSRLKSSACCWSMPWTVHDSIGVG